MNDFISSVASRLWELFDPKLLGAGAADLIANILVGFATLLAYYFVWRLVHDAPEYMSEPEPIVVVTRLNDYNVVVELRAWAHDERAHVELRPALREAAFRALNQAGVDMPFETFRVEPVTIREASAA